MWLVLSSWQLKYHKCDIDDIRGDDSADNDVTYPINNQKDELFRNEASKKIFCEDKSKCRVHSSVALSPAGLSEDSQYLLLCISLVPYSIHLTNSSQDSSNDSKAIVNRRYQLHCMSTVVWKVIDTVVYDTSVSRQSVDIILTRLQHQC